MRRRELDLSLQRTHPKGIDQPHELTPTSGERLLSLLDESGPRPVPELLAASQLSLFDFTALIEAMRASGLIIIEGQPGKEQIGLTATGQQAAGAAR